MSLILHPSLVEPLTERELEILQLIAQGYSNAEIAHRLVLTIGTVKLHAHHIYGKLAVTNRTQAVAKARELGLLPAA
jgi:LuxR family maltose regulon positive regulatory protein